MSDNAGAARSGRQAAAAGPVGQATASGAPARGRPVADGTPEQVHLTWGPDPARGVIVSWVSPGRAERPRVRIGQRVIAAAQRAYADPLTGPVTWAYHAPVDGLRPGATYGYAVTADNDANAADPFSATFTTAPGGRAGFRFTSLGDLAARGDAVADSWQAASAAGAVETFQPLFHLFNAGLTAGGPGPAVQERARRDFANSVQPSAANRPWLPVPGGCGPLTRDAGPGNGLDALTGPWYAFRVGTAFFVCLDGEGPGSSGPEAETRWLESVLAAARSDRSVDWIVAQLHPCACSPATHGRGPRLRRAWRQVFDTYEVDLVLSGHGHEYERSFPVRGVDPGAGTGGATGAYAAPRRAHPVTTADSGVFDTSQGTAHLVLGHGIAVFDLSPGSEMGGQTSLAVRYYRPAADQAGPPGDYALLESFTLVRPRSDGRRWQPRR